MAGAGCRHSLASVHFPPDDNAHRESARDNKSHARAGIPRVAVGWSVRCRLIESDRASAHRTMARFFLYSSHLPPPARPAAQPHGEQRTSRDWICKPPCGAAPWKASQSSAKRCNAQIAAAPKTLRTRDTQSGAGRLRRVATVHAIR